MDAQALQKSYRLPRSLLALGLLGSLAGLGACARDLKSDEELALAPKEFEQKIVSVDLETLEMPPASPAVSPLAPSDKSSTATRPASSTNAKAAPAPVTRKSGSSAKSSAKAAPEPVKSETPPAPRPVLSRVWPMGVGEKIAYNLRWGLIEAGVVSLEVRPPQNLEGVPALHYYGQVKSSKVMDLFYKIDNSMDAWVRLSDLAPLRQEIKQLESARWGRRVMLVEPEKNRVKFYEHLTKSNGEVKELKRNDKMLPGAQDIFGALYFYRFVQEGFEEGFKFPIHDKGRNWFADLRYEGRETVRVPAGVFKTRRAKVIPRLDGHLEPKGDVVVWTTDDDRNLLVKFNAKIKVGSLTGELIEHVEGKGIDLALPAPLTPVEKATARVAKD